MHIAKMTIKKGTATAVPKITPLFAHEESVADISATDDNIFLLKLNVFITITSSSKTYCYCNTLLCKSQYLNQFSYFFTTNIQLKMQNYT